MRRLYAVVVDHNCRRISNLNNVDLRIVRLIYDRFLIRMIYDRLIVNERSKYARRIKVSRTKDILAVFADLIYVKRN